MDRTAVALGAYFVATASSRARDSHPLSYREDSSMPTASPTTAECDHFIRLPAVRQITALSTAQLYRLMQDGCFPRTIVLGPNARAWPLSEIKAWQAERIAARDTGEDAASRAVNPNIGRGRKPKQATVTAA